MKIFGTTIPSGGVTEIGEYIISECYLLTNIAILNIIEIVGRHGLFGEVRLNGIELPESIC